MTVSDPMDYRAGDAVRLAALRRNRALGPRKAR
jgi:hypothetical protein